MMSVLYEHVETSIDERFELVSLRELRLEFVPIPLPVPDWYIAWRDSDTLRLLEA